MAVRNEWDYKNEWLSCLLGFFFPEILKLSYKSVILKAISQPFPYPPSFYLFKNLNIKRCSHDVTVTYTDILIIKTAM